MSPRSICLLLFLLLTPGVVQAEPQPQPQSPRPRLHVRPPQVEVEREIALEGRGAVRPKELQAGVARLRAWMRRRKYQEAAPAYVRTEAEAKPKGATSVRAWIRIPISLAGRRVPASDPGGPRLLRRPAEIVWRSEAERPAARAERAAPRLPRGWAPTRIHNERVIASGAAKVERTQLELVVEATGRADVGLYTDFGAHPNAIRTAGAACLDAGLTLRLLGAREVNAGRLERLVRCMLMPGGWAVDYKRDIDAGGIRHLRRFVETGGGYVGICAGAFFAASDVEWEGTNYAYPLGLFHGSAVGPIPAIAPWPKHALARLTLAPAHALTKGLAKQRQAFYLGGGAFRTPKRDRASVHVVARYGTDDTPAIVTLRTGRGRVFLSGVHLEYDLTSARDDLTWPESEGRLHDPESDWDLFQRGVRWAVGASR